MQLRVYILLMNGRTFQKTKKSWLNYINEFQNNDNENFSESSFIDLNYLENINKFSPLKETKRNIKRLLNGKQC